MKFKIALIIAILFVSGLQSNAQQSTTNDEMKKSTFFSGILSINSWIQKLTIMYKDIVSEEKKDECILKLGYLGSDLEYLSVAKRKILHLAEKGETNDLSKKVAEISTTTTNLVYNVSSLNQLVNDNLGKLGNLELNRVQNELAQEKMKMHILMEKDIKSANFIKFKADADTAIKILDSTKLLVWGLRAELLKTK